MKNIRSFLFAAIALAALALFAPIVAHAQEAAAWADATVSAPAPAVDISAIIGALSNVVPHWLTVALSIFGTVSIGYQALIAWAHKRAAETADVQDDQWLASLEAKTWFRILDRIFYWGGYAGSAMGGKKL